MLDEKKKKRNRCIRHFIAKRIKHRNWKLDHQIALIATQNVYWNI